jgi:hypothetical protein
MAVTLSWREFGMSDITGMVTAVVYNWNYGV